MIIKRTSVERVTVKRPDDQRIIAKRTGVDSVIINNRMITKRTNAHHRSVKRTRTNE